MRFVTYIVMISFIIKKKLKKRFMNSIGKYKILVVLIYIIGLIYLISVDSIDYTIGVFYYSVINSL